MRKISDTQSSFGLFVTAVAAIAFGFVMLLFCLAYAKDLNTLVNAPFAVWNALCGQPSADPLTMPILLILSVFAVITGVVLLVIRRVRLSAT